MLVGTAVILLVLDWRLALATLAVIPFMSVATALFRSRSARAYAAVRERLGLVTATLAEDIAGHADGAGVHAASERATENFRDGRARYRDANMQTVVLNALYFPFVSFLSTLALAVVLGYGGYLYFRRRDHARDAVRLHALRAELLRPGPAAVAALQHVPLGDGRARQDHRRARRGAGDRRPPGAQRARRTSRGTSASRTCASPTASGGETGEEVLHGIDLDVPAGTTVALVGHTGAGKSTIAKLLARFYDPTSGRITIDGVDLQRRDAGVAAPPARDRPAGGLPLRRHGRREHRLRPARRDARRRSSAPRRPSARTTSSSRLEDGYDTQLGERGSRLSLGQRQLVAFARALLADPRILILDEATSSVDIGTERKIEQALRTLLADRTSFVIAHRLSTIRDADLIVVLEHGRVDRAGLARRAARAPRALHVAVRRLGRLPRLRR